MSDHPPSIAPSASSQEADRFRAGEWAPGLIQPHGMLVAVDPAQDFAPVVVSANAAALPGGGPAPHRRSLAELLGVKFDDALRRECADNPPGRTTPWHVTVDGPAVQKPFDVTCHAAGDHMLIELEAADAADAERAMVAARHLQHAIALLRAERGGLEALCASTLRSIRRLTGYERSLVYRFGDGTDGGVIAEDRAAGWAHGLVGQHLPAFEMCLRTRALHVAPVMRWVVSGAATPVRLLWAPGFDGTVDLSHAMLLSQRPIHRRVHHALGVDAALSLTISADGEPWGLIVCHHRQSYRVSAGQRAAAAALADAFGLRVAGAERGAGQAVRRAGQANVDQLIGQMADGRDLQHALTGGGVTLLDVFGAVGAAVVQAEVVTPLGATPAQPALIRLVRWLRSNANAAPVWALTKAELPDWAPSEGATGALLAIYPTDDRSDLLIWFRSALDGPWPSWVLEAGGRLRQAATELLVRSLRHAAAVSEQAWQQQKIEAVGQLSGGLAHDLNNLLGGITGSLELALTRIAQGRIAELDRYIDAASGAAQRAAALTHRLLAFSRQQTLDPKPTDVNRLVAAMGSMTALAVGPAVTVDCVTSAGLWTVLCDGSQLENALLNLALNARDAMPTGGKLTIEATNSRIDDSYAAQFGIPPGHYVAVSVSDTGLGMSPSTATRAFDPFFTTKPLGQGTGLGLSMVWGFAKQSGGHARIYSEPNEGTTVRVYLPRYGGPPESMLVPTAANATATAATVLVVDDEPLLRMLVAEVLEENGLSVVLATNGDEAIDVVQSDRSLDLLVTDVGLPGGRNGRQVAEAARALRPGLKVLFITGYAENAALSGGVLDATTHVLTKPFSMETLIAKVGAMLA